MTLPTYLTRATRSVRSVATNPGPVCAILDLYEGTGVRMETNTDQRLLVSVSAACQLLQVGRSTLREMEHDGRLVPVDIGHGRPGARRRCIRYRWSDLELLARGSHE